MEYIARNIKGLDLIFGFDEEGYLVYLDLGLSKESLVDFSIKDRQLDPSSYDRTIREIEAYLEGTRRGFTFKYRLQGTSFQKKVWKATEKIPYGRTQTYEGLAKSLGNPRAARAVGAALAKNPLMLVIPCHRVLRKDGSLGGFRRGEELKLRLLKHESLSMTRLGNET